MSTTETDAGTTLVQGTVLADWNAEVPQDSPYLVRAVVDNNSRLGVALDLNQQRPEGPPLKPEEPPVEPPPDPESAWIGDRRDSDAIDLPHSRYASPDLTFKDPEDLEEDYEAFAEIREGLAEQVNEPEQG